MQTIIIINNVILNIVCLICIYLNALKTDIKLFDIITKAVLPGGIIGVGLALLIVRPITVVSVIASLLSGALTGEMFYLFYYVTKSVWLKEKTTLYYDDGTPPKFFITGDKHRNFNKVKNFCRDMNTRRKDVLIVLGDTGFNYYGDERDDELKREISKLNITLFCLHGNKENRPQNISTYGIKNFCGSKVYYEPQYPNILFAIDGEIYTFEDKKYMVIGGAHSVDKMRCLENKLPFWEDEMPNEATKIKVEFNLCKQNNDIYGMLTHTCPIKYLPVEMFMSTAENTETKKKLKKSKSEKVFKPDIDRSTEEWLGKLEKRIKYNVWFCGHYHIDKQIDKVNMMCYEIRPLHLDLFGDR